MKFRVINSWENLSYEFDGKPLDLDKIDSIVLSGKNGSIGCRPLVKKIRTEVNDMGTKYYVMQDRLFGSYPISGIPLEIDLVSNYAFVVDIKFKT